MAEDREILRQTVGLVATALGEGWKVETAEDYTWQTSIKGPGDAWLFFTKGDSYAAFSKVQVSYGLSHLADNLYQQGPRDLKQTTIKVSRERGPEVIAKEIRRRLLPDLEQDTQRVLEAVAQDRAALAARRALAEKLTGYSLREDDDAKKVRLGRASDGWYGDASLYYNADQVSLELRGLTPAQALAVLEVVRNAAPVKGGAV